MPARPALPAPSQLRGLPASLRVDPGEVPSLQDLGVAPATAAAAEDGDAGPGGESEGLRRLAAFMAEARRGRGRALPGSAYGSNFANSIAPWLATGCLSPRQMRADAERELAEGGAAAAAPAAPAATTPAPPGAGGPLRWIEYELLWRDFFCFIARKHAEGAASGQAAAQRAPALAAAAAG